MPTAHISSKIQLLALSGLLGLASSSFAQRSMKSDQTHFGHSIRVAENDQISEVTCIGCSIYIRGQVAGDATAVGGSVYLEGQGQVSGDATAVGGSIRLDSTTKVFGDVTTVAGEVRRAPGAQIGGDVTSIGGGAWLPLMLLAPFVFLGLLVWLVVWLVERARTPAVATSA